VVDNFGDIGICWRLARQLVREHGWQVRLWVDDFISFATICPDIDPAARVQQHLGVHIRYWQSDVTVNRLPVEQDAELAQGWVWQVGASASENTTVHNNANLTTDLTTADVVIEGLACTIPRAYLHGLSQHNPSAIWLNLEYLSAEDWVEGCHGLPSPQPGISLPKYFFFPGFTPMTGGLLREHNMMTALAAYRHQPTSTTPIWQQLGVDEPSRYGLKISLFGYGQRNIAPWLATLSQHADPVLVLVPKGVLAHQLCALWPELAAATPQQPLQRGALSLFIMPFLPQPDYDRLLAVCDINFVRGEDSIIRAHWAAQPFVWQIYRQDEGAHRIKLDAFLDKYLQGAPFEFATQLRALFHGWDDELDISLPWQWLLEHLDLWRAWQQHWLAQLHQQQDLASNLVRFCENKLIMSRNFS
jgi:uncharacterized repeat protein (TIGR03837 family)